MCPSHLRSEGSWQGSLTTGPQGAFWLNDCAFKQQPLTAFKKRCLGQICQQSCSVEANQAPLSQVSASSHPQIGTNIYNLYNQSTSRYII